jgi:uncharacterized protein YdaU (DUF1376 family)
MSKLPYLPLYVADYLLDTQPLSTNARGIWIDVLCLMWRDGQRGVMTKSIDDWCRTLRCSEADFLTAIVEFLHNLTCKVLKDDIKRTVRLTNRRMVRESKDRKLNRLYVQRHRSKNACKDNVSALSAVSSESDSESESESELREEKKDGIIVVDKPRPITKRASIFPDGFEPDERAQTLAASYGLNPYKEVAAFRDHHTAKGSVFKDWQAAFRTWLRNSLRFNQRSHHAMSRV